MSKQDRQGVRKATDLEQKYNFGKSFAEVMGIATDAQKSAESSLSAADEAKEAAALAKSEAEAAKKAAESAQDVADLAEADLAKALADLESVTSRVDATEEEIASAQAAVATAQEAADKAKADAESAQATAESAQRAAENAQAAVDALDGSLDSEEVLRRLTNDYTLQGLYRGDDGELLINASYIKTGEFLADLIKAGVIKSRNGNGVVIDLDNGVGTMARGISATLTTWDDETMGFTKDLNEVIIEFLTEKVTEMEEGIIKDYAITVYDGATDLAIDLSLQRYSDTMGQPWAAASFEWSDGSLSNMRATYSSVNAVWEWGEMAWVNPPMYTGVEYLTTEKYMGYPVYVQLVSFGYLPNTARANKTVYYGGENGSQRIHQGDIIDIAGRAYLGQYAASNAAGEWSAFPFVSGGTAIGADMWYDWLLGITVRTQSDLSNQQAYFTIKYTKRRIDY